MELNVDICSDIFEVFFEIGYYNFFYLIIDMNNMKYNLLVQRCQ